MTAKILLALREATSRLIAENPVEITIHRIEYVDDGAGGRVKQESDLPPFTGRLVPSRLSQVRISRNEAGGIQTSAWTLIAPWDADLRAGSDVVDMFTVDGQSFRVSRVVIRKYQGQITKIHAVLEEVS